MKISAAHSGLLRDLLAGDQPTEAFDRSTVRLLHRFGLLNYLDRGQTEVGITERGRIALALYRGKM